MAAVLPLDVRSYELPPLTRRASGSRQPRPRASRRIPAAVLWRRRAIAALLGLGFVLTAARAGAALGGSPASPARLPHVTSVVVQPGDSLWSVAHRLAPHSDPRAVVDALTEARGTAALMPGETLTWLDS
jgi:hypothetical protein